MVTDLCHASAKIDAPRQNLTTLASAILEIWLVPTKI